MKILVAEDEPMLLKTIELKLKKEGYDVIATIDGREAISKIESEQPDLVISDIMMPYASGLELTAILKKREKQIPIIILSAMEQEKVVMEAFELGADDYVIKPVEPRVLLARVHALLRRGSPAQKTENQELSFGKLNLNNSAREAHFGGDMVELTSYEFDLLWMLAKHAGQTVKREAIHKKMIGREYDGLDRTVDVRVSHLRRKLNDNAETPFRIKTVWGKGYLFVADAWNN